MYKHPIHVPAEVVVDDGNDKRVLEVTSGKRGAKPVAPAPVPRYQWAQAVIRVSGGARLFRGLCSEHVLEEVALRLVSLRRESPGEELMRYEFLTPPLRGFMKSNNTGTSSSIKPLEPMKLSPLRDVIQEF